MIQDFVRNYEDQEKNGGQNGKDLAFQTLICLFDYVYFKIPIGYA